MLERAVEHGGVRSLDNAFSYQNVLYTRAHVFNYGLCVVGLASKRPDSDIFIGKNGATCPTCGKVFVFSIKWGILLGAQHITGLFGKIAKAMIPLASMLSMALLLSPTFTALQKLSLKMLSTLTDQETLSKLLLIPEGNSVSSLFLYSSNIHVILSKVQLGFFPIYLSAARGASIELIAYVGHFYEIFLLARSFQYSRPLIFVGLKVLEWLSIAWMKILLNRYYYRSTMKVTPLLLHRNTSPRALHASALETQRIHELEEHIDKQVDMETNWLGKWLTWCIPLYYPEQKLQLAMENEIVIDRDFVSPVHESPQHNYWNLFWRIGTTMLWPFGGSIVGSILEKCTPINKMLYFCGTTGEISLVRNVIGMGVLALARDILRLYLSTRVFRHYDEGIEILDEEMSLETTKFIGPMAIFREKPFDLNNTKDIASFEISKGHRVDPDDIATLIQLPILPVFDPRSLDHLGIMLFGVNAWRSMPDWSTLQMNCYTWFTNWVNSY